jgi:hypothetical protein
MGNQRNSLFKPIKKQKKLLNIARNVYFSNIWAFNSGNRNVNKSVMYEIELSQEELDRSRKEADEMGLPDSLDCLND